MMKPTVSVVVACRNEASEIHMLLGSLQRQEVEGFEWKVVIADGMSTDGTRQILAEFCRENPFVSVIDNPGQIVSTGLNAALDRARGDIIIRLDAHSQYARDYIRQCVAVLHETGADNVGGAMRAQIDSTLRARLFAAAFNSRFAVGGAHSKQPEFEGYTDTVFGGCWRRETLDRLGGFDESLVRNQDDELNLRLTRSGGKVWQSRRIVCRYRPRRTLSSLALQCFQYGFWKVAVIKKHRIPARIRHLVPGTFVAMNLALCLMVIAALALGLSVAPVLAAAWITLLGTYVLACLVAAAAHVKSDGLRVAALLPAVFATYHLSYGFGFLAGFVLQSLGIWDAAPRLRLFTSLSR